MTKLLRAGSLADGRDGALELETSEGPLEIRFTYEDAERLIAGLQAARAKIQAERVHAAKPPLPEKPKEPARWETSIDPVNQVALIRAHFADRTTQDTRIPRSEIGAITAFLEQAAKRFAAGAEWRQ